MCQYKSSRIASGGSCCLKNRAGHPASITRENTQVKSGYPTPMGLKHKSQTQAATAAVYKKRKYHSILSHKKPKAPDSL